MLFIGIHKFCLESRILLFPTTADDDCRGSLGKPLMLGQQAAFSSVGPLSASETGPRRRNATPSFPFLSTYRW